MMLGWFLKRMIGWWATAAADPILAIWTDCNVRKLQTQFANLNFPIRLPITQRRKLFVAHKIDSFDTPRNLNLLGHGFIALNKCIPLLFDNQLGSWSHLSDSRRVLITHVSSVNTQTIKNNRLPWYFRLDGYCIQYFYQCRPTDISWYPANDRTSKRFSIFLDLCVKKQDFYQSNSRYYTQILMLNAIKCTFCLSY